MKVIDGIKKYGAEYIRPLIIAIVFAMAGSIFTIVGPSQLSKITDLISKGLFGKINLTQVMHIVVILAAIYVAAAILSYGQGYIMATITQRFTQKLRTKITEKINNLPLQYFDTHNEGDTLSRVTNDLDTVGQSLNQSLGLLVSAVTLLLGSIVMMFTTNIKLGTTAVLSVLVGFALTILLISKSQRYFYNQQNKLADVSGYLEEIYAGHDVVKTYNYTNQARQEFTQLNDDLQTNVWKSQFLSGIMQPLMNFIGNFGYVMVSVVGAVLVLKGQISIGVIVAFMIYVRLFTQPLSQITQAFTSLQSAQAAMKRVFNFLGEKEVETDDDKQTLSGTKGNVEFDNVEFGYLPDQKIIKNFSMKAKAGQKVAIVGPTGSGKTTTVNLLMRFYDLNSGKITIDGVDIKDMPRSDVRNQFDMVLQEAWIFEDTVRNNLVYNQKNISDEQIKAATKAVDLDHFIETLPNGYDTVLDDSVSLSVGQKQLLTIARALIRNAPMLILDEATSSVDTRTEEQIQKAMDVLMKGRTSFVIAHRLSTIKNADMILVVKDGEIIERGTHEELMTQNGFYTNMYNSQFTKE
ncbi:ABC transporter ATP-binding protein [Companilactobacillus kimchii]|uniref:ABC transporter ATP-binding protein n=2 Tax=Companilactobacillus kimchii TaxID=2801452 RepID=A0ABR5NUP9_9LACO|nr:ABC transporter ATP-binding protein [Companilactobacillus kimchii]KAE9557433.1 ABC transporter [Companilactobacillus kimchii]KRK52544.1 ABC transporter ATP-binding protein [Companilactobacillus kimchii DSM 13961 = JCM 10707]OWF32662.1 Lipid A export ATP-binding/permease protein MsbA [Companilactobacillus kimchii]GEO47463.1 ABC transporter ATP-binding protein [Companilactobacillus paralimentarius]